MVFSAFLKVKEAIPPHADAILAEHGIKHHRKEIPLGGEWTTGFLCPFCGDTSGSASFTHELYLRCHQCSYKGDVFDWISKHTGKKPWDVCKQLADRCSVKLEKPAGTGKGLTNKSMPARMTEEALERAMHDLWEHKDAQPARDVLERRKIDDPKLLGELGVGWIKGWIVFTRRDDGGTLEERYRGWAPDAKDVKWRWFGQGTGGPGIWPNAAPPAGHRVLLCEGEGDTLVSLIRLRMRESGWWPCTWTAGAGSSPQVKDVPPWVNGREVHIAYDNDVFQGPDWHSYIVVTKPGKNPDHARTAAEQRLRNLVNRVGPTFVALHCKVFVHKCPVDPAVTYGGDLRDWADAGGLDFEKDWLSWSLEELPSMEKAAVMVPFDEVFGHLHKRVKTTATVDAIRGDDLIVPKVMRMECLLGQHPACATCYGYQQFPDGLINMDEFERERVVAIESGKPNEFVAKNIVQKPARCPRLEIVTVQSVVGSEWLAMRPHQGDMTAQRALRVVSTEEPSMSGEMELTGSIYGDYNGKGVVMFANKCTALDRTEIDLAPHIQDLRSYSPSESKRPEDIDDFLERRWRDLSANVTRIHGRKDIQIAHDLLAHSVIEFRSGGALQRGWLDITVFGETRSGKSLTFRRMLEHHGLGVHHTAVSNVSRPGLVMGANKDGLLKPGLFPKCHRKMLMMDEWHFLCANVRGMEHPMSWLQSARDEGRVSGVKIYGARDLPAKVRFVTIGNWIRNRRHTYEHPCQHVLALYGAPEMISRLDFALAVNADPTELGLPDAEQFWTRDRTRALILRAWAQEHNQVFIDADAEQLALDYCHKWKGHYDSEMLPLFTPEEKATSVLRIAVSVANLCFSYHASSFYATHVRACHVEWAASWLQHVWQESGYDRYSASRLAAQVVDKKFEAERMLTVNLGLEDPLVAENTLAQFLQTFNMQDVMAVTGKEAHDALKWIAKLQALRVIERIRATNTTNLEFLCTKGGERLISNLLLYARNHEPSEWVERFNRIRTWIGPEEPQGLVPMTAEPWEIAGGDNHRQTLPF